MDNAGHGMVMYIYTRWWRLVLAFLFYQYDAKPWNTGEKNLCQEEILCRNYPFLCR
jgi:hypothetical protein